MLSPSGRVSLIALTGASPERQSPTKQVLPPDLTVPLISGEKGLLKEK